ncbi:GntR family transcriptional regulator [Streptomyces sp. NPDC000229]|uniref:GntR family transcriptional regulator n=1 Tax=Streptomyces sp. NPDC000229 TaxID=3154247 RepID=UPI00332373E6
MYVAVADHIAARIVAGELRPGMRLPAERALAEQVERRAAPLLATLGIDTPGPYWIHGMEVA